MWIPSLVLLSCPPLFVQVELCVCSELHILQRHCYNATTSKLNLFNFSTHARTHTHLHINTSTWTSHGLLICDFDSSRHPSYWWTPWAFCKRTSLYGFRSLLEVQRYLLVSICGTCTDTEMKCKDCCYYTDTKNWCQKMKCYSYTFKKQRAEWVMDIL